jgi:surface antigen
MGFKMPTPRSRLAAAFLIIFLLATGSASAESITYSTLGYPWHAAPVVDASNYDWGYSTCPANDSGCMAFYGYLNGVKYGEADPWRYYLRNCTSFVAWKLSTLGVDPNYFTGLLDGGDWWSSAPGKGATVDGTPTAGAAAVVPATYDSQGKKTSFGHVAFVTGVDSQAGTITVQEYNHDLGATETLGLEHQAPAASPSSCTSGGSSPTSRRAVIPRRRQAPMSRRGCGPISTATDAPTSRCWSEPRRVAASCGSRWRTAPVPASRAAEGGGRTAPGVRPGSSSFQVTSPAMAGSTWRCSSAPRPAGASCGSRRPTAPVRASRAADGGGRTAAGAPPGSSSPRATSTATAGPTWRCSSAPRPEGASCGSRRPTAPVRASRAAESGGQTAAGARRASRLRSPPTPA